MWKGILTGGGGSSDTDPNSKKQPSDDSTAASTEPSKAKAKIMQWKLKRRRTSPIKMKAPVHYAKKAVALYKVFEFDNCEVRNVLIMRIGHRSKMQEYAR
jgi:hypothetical protein